MSEEVLQLAKQRREVKGKEERERYTQLNAEFQRKGEMKRSSSMNNAKKSRKTIEWERLQISLRKLEVPGNISCKDWHHKTHKVKDLTEAERLRSVKKTQNYKKKLLMTWITTMMWSPT